MRAPNVGQIIYGSYNLNAVYFVLTVTNSQFTIQVNSIFVLDSVRFGNKSDLMTVWFVLIAYQRFPLHFRTF